MDTIPEPINYKEFPILYIDDLKDNLKSFKDTFEDDFTIFLVESAEQALTLLEKKHITVVIADQRMPKMTGVEFFKIIKEKYPQIIRILITAYSDIDAVIAAINEGCVYSYIGKPIETKDLREKIQKGIYTYYLIKERDRLYEEKLEAMKKLARANRLNAAISMASGFVDRLNNYLVAINLFLDNIPKKLDEVGNHLSNEIKEILKTLYYPSRSSIDKMLKLAQEITNLYTSPKYNFQKEEAKVIIDLVDEVIKEIKPSMGKKDITISKALEKNSPATYFDRDTIKQVLYHLLRNAVDAIPETVKGSILVKVTGPIRRSGREFLRITIQDNGLGIRKEDRENIFNPFFTTKGTSGGFGLGLTTCQFIITQHDGEIELAESEPGKGTIINVDLPIRTEPPETPVDYGEILSQFPNRKK